MRRVVSLAVLVALVGGLGFGLGALSGSSPGASARQSDECLQWLDETAQRVFSARQILYPAERPGAAGGDAFQAAQILDQIAQEQANSPYPQEGEEVNFDLVEAMTAGAAGLAGAAGQAPETLITFAKAIVYNADARLIAVEQSC